MDSPVAAGKDKEVAPSSSSKPSPSKDSPFFNYLSSLSPITQTKDSRVGQRLFHVSSPPPVFTSPRENKIIRLQNSEPSTAGFLSLYSHGDEISATVPAISQSTTAESQLLLMPYTRAFDKKLLVEAQDNSPAGSVDKYLADPSEQRENSCSPGLGFQKAIDLPQNSKTVTECAERTILNVDGDGNNQKDREIEVAQLTSSVERASDAPLTAKLFVDPIGSGGNCFVSIDKTLGGSPGKCIVQASEEVNDLRAESSHLSGSVQLQDQYLTNNKSSKVRCENVGNEKRMHVSSSNSHVSYALEIQAVEQHNSDMGPHGEVQPCSKFAQNIVVDEIYNAKVETTGEAGENLMAYDCKEANKFQHGARRRCLQFEAAKSHVMRIERNSSSMEPSNIIPDTSSPATPKASKPLNISSHAEIVHAIGNRQVADPSKRAASRVVLHSSSAPQNCNKKVDCPADIRASSSVTTPIPSGIGLHLNSIGKAGGISTNTQKSNFFFNRGYPLSEDSKGSVLKVSPITIIAPKSSQRLSIGLPFSTYEKEMLVGNDTCKVEDLSEISPCKKRKKSAYNSVDEGCKRCNCKKSKCLKLYCECFAAGVYCAGPCACQNCFNKPEYEDTVLETRQLIESRNPLAFAPRVVHSVVESPQNIGEEGNRTTPASARHKRGCNCKRSSCLKKYCECFQAGVGCSDGCRCDGCKNIFGRKGGMGIMGIEHRNSEAERWNKEYQGKVTVAETTSKMVQLEAGDDSVHLEQCPADSTSPPRPLFRCSNRGIVLPRSWQHSRKHLTSSPESESSAVSSYGKSPRSPMTSSLNVRLLKSSAYSDELGYHMPSKTRDGLADKCDDSLTTTVHQSGRAASGTNYCPKGSQGLHSYGRRISMHDSPVTPIAHFFGAKYVGPDQDSSSNNLEDETPDILKETRSPIKTVKASSPNQKRVSPPHKCLQEIRSSTSPSFKSGRKFILKSVPSFPPLTPYSDSKGIQK